MKMLEVESMLKDLRNARERWGQGHAEFRSGYNAVLTRLVHEAAVNYMGVAQIAQALGVGQGVVRKKMRDVGLDPRGGKRALNSKASQALLDNAELMGIEPGEMDLTSPLAYLPMGEELRKQYRDRTVSQVHELPSDEYAEIERWADDHFTQGEVAIVMRLADEFGWRPVSGNLADL